MGIVVFIIAVLIFLILMLISDLTSPKVSRYRLHKICPVCGSETKVILSKWRFGKFEYRVKCPKCGEIEYEFGLHADEIAEVEEECKEEGIEYVNLIRR